MTLTDNTKNTTKILDYIIYNGDKYFPLNNQYVGYPRITGLPEIEWKDYVTNIKRNVFTRKPSLSLIPTPNDCAFRHVVNYPISKWGAFQFILKGLYGYGKSNFIHLLMALLLARNHRLLMFDDEVGEFRTLAAHGYFDKNNIFHPFEIDVFIPKGYSFDESADNHNPIWNHRNNVHLKEFTQLDEIIDNLKPHKLTVVYTSAFDKASVIRIWIGLMNLIKRKTTLHKSYIFVMHEIADLFPEGARKEIYALIEDCLEILRRLRKNRIGILGGFHEDADVTYKVNHKFGFVGQKRPVNKKNFTPLEEYARRFNRSQIAISQGGYFREHTIKKFPEIKDNYRIVANAQPWHYSDENGLLSALEYEEIPKSNKENKHAELLQTTIITLHERGLKQDEIATIINKTQQYVSKKLSQYKKEGLVF